MLEKIKHFSAYILFFKESTKYLSSATQNIISYPGLTCFEIAKRLLVATGSALDSWKNIFEVLELCRHAYKVEHAFE